MATEKVKTKLFGDLNIPVMAILSLIFVWCSALSVTAFNQHGDVAGLTASVADIKDSVSDVKSQTKDIPDMKAKIDFLAEQRGYKAPPTDISLASSSVIR